MDLFVFFLVIFSISYSSKLSLRNGEIYWMNTRKRTLVVNSSTFRLFWIHSISISICLNWSWYNYFTYAKCVHQKQKEEEREREKKYYPLYVTQIDKNISDEWFSKTAAQIEWREKTTENKRKINCRSIQRKKEIAYNSI